jgi:hypothetical protein
MIGEEIVDFIKARREATGQLSCKRSAASCLPDSLVVSTTGFGLRTPVSNENQIVILEHPQHGQSPAGAVNSLGCCP